MYSNPRPHNGRPERLPSPSASDPAVSRFLQMAVACVVSEPMAGRALVTVTLGFLISPCWEKTSPPPPPPPPCSQSNTVTVIVTGGVSPVFFCGPEMCARAGNTNSFVGQLLGENDILCLVINHTLALHCNSLKR